MDNGYAATGALLLLSLAALVVALRIFVFVKPINRVMDKTNNTPSLTRLRISQVLALFVKPASMVSLYAVEVIESSSGTKYTAVIASIAM